MTDRTPPATGRMTVQHQDEVLEALARARTAWLQRAARTVATANGEAHQDLAETTRPSRKQLPARSNPPHWQERSEETEGDCAGAP